MKKLKTKTWTAALKRKVNNLTEEKEMSKKEKFDCLTSAADSQQQMKRQEMEGHYCLHTAYIGKGKKMTRSGFKDFTLGEKDPKESFAKAIKEEPRGNVYVEINYYIDKTHLKVWKAVTWDEYVLLPTTWKEFKKIVS